MSSVKSRHQGHERSRNAEDEMRSWRSPHHKPATDRFRPQGGRGRDNERSHDRGRDNGHLDRAGGHRTRHRHDRDYRDSKSSRSEKGRHGEPKSQQPDIFCSSQFPSLGSISDISNANEKYDSKYTPEPNRTLSQRHSSTSGLDWASQIEQFERDKEVAQQDMMKYKRRLLMSESSDCSNEEQDNQRVNMDAKPKKVYETDEVVIVRRQKQIALGKNTLGYEHYVKLIPKYKRVKNKHIFTPNKFQKCSRRAWDGLIRQWRRQLHDYDPEGTYKPEAVARKELTFSDTTSEGTSEASSEVDARMDLDLNASLSSAISDYLASNESSRPETPVSDGPRPVTPTAQLQGLTVDDHLNGNWPAESTPEATLTPTVTPAEQEAAGQGGRRAREPQLSPVELIAALQNASGAPAAVRTYAAATARPIRAPLAPTNLNARPLADMNANGPAKHESLKPTCDDIFNNFNLDECLKSDGNIIG